MRIIPDTSILLNGHELAVKELEYEPGWDGTTILVTLELEANKITMVDGKISVETV